jgi:hypothetical protein
MFTAINVWNSEILKVYNVEVQKWYLGKNTKKNKKYEIFQGVTFCFSWLHNSNFYIFYFGIWSAYPELPIQVEVEFRLSIKMRPLGAPRPPAKKISSPDMTRFPAVLRLLYRIILSRSTAATICTIVVIPPTKEFWMGPEIVFPC